MPTETKRSLSRSWELWERAKEVIPMATQTHSKAPREALRGIEPCFLERGQGGHVWDLDGNEYLDFRCSLGPITLGHRFPAIESAVRAQLELGTVFSYPHRLEVEVAEALVEAIPCAEMVRFLRTGGEAMAATMKLARAYTGRDRILKCGYHGWLTTMAGDGVPEAVRSVHTELPWGAVDRFAAELEADADHIAAITVAYSYSAGDAAGGFLRALRELADKHHVLLIFDEIVTGFRLARGGAQERFRVTPDLAVVSKGMANGWPIAAYLGRREVMETVKSAVISSTFGGETTGLAAAKAALEVYASEDVIGRLDLLGRRMMQGYNDACEAVGAPARMIGLPPCPQLVWSNGPELTAGELALRLDSELLQRGVITYSVMYVNYSHTDEDLEQLLARLEEALAAMQADGCFG